MSQITKYSYRWATSINVYDAVLSNVMFIMMDPLMPLLHLLTSLGEGLRCQEMKVSFHGSLDGYCSTLNSFIELSLDFPLSVFFFCR